MPARSAVLLIAVTCAAACLAAGAAEPASQPSPQYRNPIVLQRADPFIVRHTRELVAARGNDETDESPRETGSGWRFGKAPEPDRAGHVGGDDFITMTTPDKAQTVFEWIAKRFDERITAFYCGFAGADDYYDRAAASHVIERIARPTLVIHAVNDPFIRILPETREKLLSNRNITYVETQDGGHCSFVSKRDADPAYDGRWAEREVVEFAKQFL